MGRKESEQVRETERVEKKEDGNERHTKRNRERGKGRRERGGGERRRAREVLTVLLSVS